jgi:hypothetical protein
VQSDFLTSEMTAMDAKALPKLIPITFGSFVDVDVRGAPAAAPFGIAIGAKVKKKLAELEFQT